MSTRQSVVRRCWRQLFTILCAALAASWLAAFAPRRASCIENGCTGDCNGDGSVDINDLVMLVNVALGLAPIDQCRPGDVNGDQQVSIDEILAAVNSVLIGCPSGEPVSL